MRGRAEVARLVHIQEVVGSIPTFATMKISSAKNKGRRFQSWVRDEFKRIFGLTDDEIRCAIGSENGCDVKIDSRREDVPYAIECKNVERLNLWSAWSQAVLNSFDRTPLLVVKRNRGVPLVVMSFDEFERLHSGDRDADRH